MALLTVLEISAAAPGRTSLYYPLHWNERFYSPRQKLLSSFDWTNLDCVLPLTQSLREGGGSALTSLSLSFLGFITGQEESVGLPSSDLYLRLWSVSLKSGGGA